MPIDPKRIEAAFAAYQGALDRTPIWTHEKRRAALASALAAAYPELASDPPTAWVAPIDASDAMCTAMEQSGFGLGANLWDTARDAHTKERTP